MIKSLLCSAALFLSLASAASAKTLVVLSAGYQSCTLGGEFWRLPNAKHISIFAQSAGLFTNGLKALGDDVEMIWSCYSGIQKRRSMNEMMQKGPLVFQYGVGLPGTGVTGTKIAFNASDADNARPMASYFTFVENYVQQTQPDHIYLVGHSYGGWTMMHLGVRLANANVHLSGITLLDPISIFQCPAGVLPAALLSNWKSPPGCLMAPRDFFNSDMRLLTDHTDFVGNFYETGFATLHSSALKYDGWFNQELFPPKKGFFGDQHSGLIGLPTAWQWALNRAKSGRQ